MPMAQWRQKRGHIRHYDKTAHVYNALYAEEQRLKMASALTRLMFKGHPAIVDLGCGTGLLLPEVAKKAETIVGLDICRGMLDEAKHHTGLSSGIHLIRADVDHAPLLQGRFDVAFAVTLLQNMPRPQQTLQEMQRLTKPDAQIVVTGLKKSFTRQRFSSLLAGAGLRAQLLDTDDEVKCHVAVCTK
jgi:ubiquinone/menaquinone biosynthesis C-methylase UbiE